MRSEERNKKAGETSNKAVVASVTEEMAQAHTTKSARADADEQRKESRVKTTTQRSRRAAKRRIERYGTGTPAVEKNSRTLSESRGPVL
jgi:hypothetical protein